MTRIEAIAIINRSLMSINDERVRMLADIAQSMAEPEFSLQLSAEELAALDRSKADFRAGRTVTLDEMDVYLDASAQKRAAQPTK